MLINITNVKGKSELIQLLFHQIFWTIVGFLIFYESFLFFYKNRIVSILNSRCLNESLLKNLIDKNLQDKKFYDEEQNLLKKSIKTKVDNYIIKNLSQQEKVWQEEFITINRDLKELANDKKINLEVEDIVIGSILSSILKGYLKKDE